ncbi:MAG: type II toxin-antitoxin system VapC family toxin [Planctomycetes bacterium]|nr:type II toxin-antitoxin system VapC family toxin [Planctomycetota bacterium]
MIVLDTHAWVWWSTRVEKVGPAARAAIERESIESEVLVSAVSCWEIAMLVAKGRLTLAAEVEAWFDHALALPGIRLAPLEPRIAVLSTRLPGNPPRDPSDQIILATALHHRATLISRDTAMHSYGRVPILW